MRPVWLLLTVSLTALAVTCLAVTPHGDGDDVDERHGDSREYTSRRDQRRNHHAAEARRRGLHQRRKQGGRQHGGNLDLRPEHIHRSISAGEIQDWQDNLKKQLERIQEWPKRRQEALAHGGGWDGGRGVLRRPHSHLDATMHDLHRAPPRPRVHMGGPRRAKQAATMKDKPVAMGGHIGHWTHRLKNMGETLRTVMEPLRQRLRNTWNKAVNIGPVSLDWSLDWFGEEEQPWYDGPNVCVEREETEEEEADGTSLHRHQVTSTTSCDETDAMYRCTAEMNVYGKKKTVTVTYECCYGFERLKGESGCPRELRLVDLVETSRELGLTSLLEAVDSVKLTDTLTKDDFTIFAPSDEAFEDFEPMDMPSANVVMVTPDLMNIAKELQATLAAHMVPGFIKSNDWKDEQILESFYPKASIRINHYNAKDGQLVTANCVPVVSADHFANNGVIHKVARMLPTVTHPVISIISRDPQLSMFKTIIGKTGLVDMLSQDGQYTVFVPTNAAFDKLGKELTDQLVQTKACLKNVIKAHILKNVICSSVILGPGRTFNILDDLLYLNRTEDDKIFVEGGQVVEKDIMATNGVVHIIDNVIIPKEALDILKIMNETGANGFLDLVAGAGLEKELRGLEDFTMFIPTDRAIEALDEETKKKISEDREYLAKIVRYHIVPNTTLTSTKLYNDQELSTIDNNKKITVKEYSSFPFSVATVKTAQCAKISRVNLESCNAIGHLVDKVLLPPAGDVLDVLSQDSRFTTLLQLLKEAGISEKLQTSGPFTVFAPTNKAFDGVERELLTDLRMNTRKLKGFLAHHLMHDTLCCAGIALSSGLQWMWKPKEMTLDPGSYVVLGRRGQDILVDNTPIRSCDLSASNGVVHAVDEILPSAAIKFGLHLEISHHGERRRPLTRSGKMHDRISQFFHDSWKEMFDDDSSEEDDN